MALVFFFKMFKFFLIAAFVPALVLAQTPVRQCE